MAALSSPDDEYDSFICWCMAQGSPQSRQLSPAAFNALKRRLKPQNASAQLYDFLCPEDVSRKEFKKLLVHMPVEEYAEIFRCLSTEELQSFLDNEDDEVAEKAEERVKVSADDLAKTGEVLAQLQPTLRRLRESLLHFFEVPRASSFGMAEEEKEPSVTAAGNPVVVPSPNAVSKKELYHLFGKDNGWTRKEFRQFLKHAPPEEVDELCRAALIDSFYEIDEVAEVDDTPPVSEITMARTLKRKKNREHRGSAPPSKQDRKRSSAPTPNPKPDLALVPASASNDGISAPLALAVSKNRVRTFAKQHTFNTNASLDQTPEELEVYLRQVRNFAEKCGLSRDEANECRAEAELRYGIVREWLEARRGAEVKIMATEVLLGVGGGVAREEEVLAMEGGEKVEGEEEAASLNRSNKGSKKRKRDGEGDEAAKAGFSAPGGCMTEDSGKAARPAASTAPRDVDHDLTLPEKKKRKKDKKGEKSILPSINGHDEQDSQNLSIQSDHQSEEKGSPVPPPQSKKRRKRDAEESNTLGNGPQLELTHSWAMSALRTKSTSAADPSGSAVSAVPEDAVHDQTQPKRKKLKKDKHIEEKVEEHVEVEPEPPLLALEHLHPDQGHLKQDRSATVRKDEDHSEPKKKKRKKDKKPEGKSEEGIDIDAAPSISVLESTEPKQGPSKQNLTATIFTDQGQSERKKKKGKKNKKRGEDHEERIGAEPEPSICALKDVQGDQTQSKQERKKKKDQDSSSEQRDIKRHSTQPHKEPSNPPTLLAPASPAETQPLVGGMSKKEKRRQRRQRQLEKRMKFEQPHKGETDAVDERRAGQQGPLIEESQHEEDPRGDYPEEHDLVPDFDESLTGEEWIDAERSSLKSGEAPNSSAILPRDGDHAENADMSDDQGLAMSELEQRSHNSDCEKPVIMELDDVPLADQENGPAVAKSIKHADEHSDASSQDSHVGREHSVVSDSPTPKGETASAYLHEEAEENVIPESPQPLEDVKANSVASRDSSPIEFDEDLDDLTLDQVNGVGNGVVDGISTRHSPEGHIVAAVGEGELRVDTPELVEEPSGIELTYLFPAGGENAPSIAGVLDTDELHTRVSPSPEVYQMHESAVAASGPGDLPALDPHSYTELNELDPILRADSHQEQNDTATTHKPKSKLPGAKSMARKLNAPGDEERPAELVSFGEFNRRLESLGFEDRGEPEELYDGWSDLGIFDGARERAPRHWKTVNPCSLPGKFDATALHVTSLVEAKFTADGLACQLNGTPYGRKDTKLPICCELSLHNHELLPVEGLPSASGEALVGPVNGDSSLQTATAIGQDSAGTLISNTKRPPTDLTGTCLASNSSCPLLQNAESDTSGNFEPFKRETSACYDKQRGPPEDLLSPKRAERAAEILDLYARNARWVSLDDALSKPHILVTEINTRTASPSRKKRSTGDPSPITTPRKRTGQKSPHFNAPTPPKKPRSPAGTVSCLPFPALSAPRFGLIQEELAHDPFRLLIAVTLLNKTKGTAAIPVFHSLTAAYPTPASLAAAPVADVASRIRHLGLQNNRAETLIEFAKTWLTVPPTRGKRYRTLHYPHRGAGTGIKATEILDDNDARLGAWEVAHLHGCGPYAMDSWRIFCRDVLRGVATGWDGEGAKGGFEPEWKRVLPKDKELRAFLRWMWLREGWAWDPGTGEKEVAGMEMMRAAERGELVWDELGGLRMREAVEGEMGTEGMEADVMAIGTILNPELDKGTELRGGNMGITSSLLQLQAGPV